MVAVGEKTACGKEIQACGRDGVGVRENVGATRPIAQCGPPPVRVWKNALVALVDKPPSAPTYPLGSFAAGFMKEER